VNAPITRSIHEVLRDTWGHSAFRPVQERVIGEAMAGRDVLALLPTGGGKSLCYQVPALAMGRMALVISPLIALMNDQVAALRRRGVRARALTSELSRHEIDLLLDNAAVGRIDLLYVAPERLGTDLFAARLPRLPLGLIAVDEAHCISQWGHDFRPAYQRIGEVRAVRPEVPVMALTASATPAVVDDIQALLAFRAPNVVRGAFDRPGLGLWVDRTEDRMGRLLRIATRATGSGIVYLRERRGTVRIAEALRRAGITAEAYHAGLPFEERDRVQRDWMEGRTRVVAATNAFGMGIDKADVRFVVHLEPPPDLESYYQEAGRAGRDGVASHAVLLTHPGDAARLRDRLRASFPPIQDVRRVYQSFADMNRIALGAGMLEQYPVDLRGIAERVKLPVTTVDNALKALALDGALSLSDGARNPSRVMMRADHRDVHRLRLENARLGPLVECLLRLHGGLFEEAAMIDEGRLAAQLKWTVKRVGEGLRELQHLGLLFYRPRTDLPTATLLVPRRDAALLMLGHAALDGRRERAEQRLEAMLAYAADARTCRMRLLLAYFGEAPERDCGVCDTCRRAQRNATGPEGMRDEEAVRRERWQRDEDPHASA